MTDVTRTAAQPDVDADLKELERFVLWLAAAIVDHANRVRPNPSGLKVGGHQASSASMVSLMTTLYFRHLRSEDRVSVKPHASPVLHAIEYLLGQLDASQLQTLRQFGGLQSYPSRTKDPVPADYSTGSVGIGATAPIWGAIARRYVDSHYAPQDLGRQYSLLGDAELDEGAIWEAVFDPTVRSLGEVVWVVDFNRQSLDRVAPVLGADRFERIFGAAGWQVITVKYGRALTELFGEPGGAHLRDRIDRMSNEEYQRLLRRPAHELLDKLPGDGEHAGQIAALLADVGSDRVAAAFRDLGGHDFGALDDAFRAIDDTRPTVIIAYTIKGYGLATQGHPQNHSALLSENQMNLLADKLGMSLDDPWSRPDPLSAAGLTAELTRQRLVRPLVAAHEPFEIPEDLGRIPQGTMNTQTALGRALLDIARAAPQVGERIVTVAPDVSSSTNLGGWVNKFGVWAVEEGRDWFEDDSETVLHWKQRSSGRHIELGIAETNLVGLLGELGATWSRWGQPLIPIGTVYDPFVARALEPWSFGMYAGGQSILVGTPSGVTLAPEGGAHQSIITPSIGLEQPGCTSWEPAFALDTQWCLLAAMKDIGRPDGSSAYLRLSTRAIDQALADVPEDSSRRERRRRLVVAGGYPLRRAEQPSVTLVAMGAVTPNAIGAARLLEEQGVQADLICVTSADLLFRDYHSRGRGGRGGVLDVLFPPDRRTPLVTILDGHPHTLAFLAAVTGTRAAHLGVTGFGQSGDLDSVYRYHGLDVESIADATLDLIGRA